MVCSSAILKFKYVPYRRPSKLSGKRAQRIDVTIQLKSPTESESGKVTSASVTDCDSDPCILKAGTKPEITISFDSSVETKSVGVDIKGIIGGFPFPFPGPKLEGCVGSGLTCPLEKGKSYTYKNSMSVSPAYPKIDVVVQYILKDDNGKNIACVKIPSKIE